MLVTGSKETPMSAPSAAPRSLRPPRWIPIALLFLTAATMATAMPILMDRFDEHPQARQEQRGRCVICHVNADGSGALTAFGKKYDRTDLKFTDSLIREYPNLFLVDGVAVGSAELTTGGTASVVVPGNEPFDVRKYYLAECTECHGKYGDGDPFKGVTAFSTAKWIAERADLTEELVEIILYGKDDMIGHAGKISDDDAHELVELIRAIAAKYS